MQILELDMTEEFGLVGKAIDLIMAISTCRLKKWWCRFSCLQTGTQLFVFGNYRLSAYTWHSRNDHNFMRDRVYQFVYLKNVLTSSKNQTRTGKNLLNILKPRDEEQIVI